MQMQIFPFDRALVKECVQLFPDELCLDRFVVYHGTSGINEHQIDRQGLRWTPGVVTVEQVLRITRIFEQMGWHGGDSGAGYPVLKGFSTHDCRGSTKPIFLAQSSYRAMLYACAEFAGGETARAMRAAIADLRLYRDSPDCREQHREYRLAGEREQRHLRDGRLPAEPPDVDLSWLDEQLATLAGVDAMLEDLRIGHRHGVVYAIRFGAGQTFLAASSAKGLEIDHVPPERIVGKVRVPADCHWDAREDPHRIRALFTGVLSTRWTG